MFVLCIAALAPLAHGLPSYSVYLYHIILELRDHIAYSPYNCVPYLYVLTLSRSDAPDHTGSLLVFSGMVDLYLYKVRWRDGGVGVRTRGRLHALVWLWSGVSEYGIAQSSLHRDFIYTRVTIISDILTHIE